MIKLKMKYGTGGNNLFFATIENDRENFKYGEIYKESYTIFTKRKREQKMNAVMRFCNKKMTLENNKQLTEKVYSYDVVEPAFETREEVEKFLKKLCWGVENIIIPSYVVSSANAKDNKRRLKSA